MVVTLHFLIQRLATDEPVYTVPGTARCYIVVSETLVGVTETLRIINTVSEYLRNIDTGGPRCARGVNAPPRGRPRALCRSQVCGISGAVSRAGARARNFP